MIPIIFFMDKSFYFRENNVILYLFSDVHADIGGQIQYFYGQ
jgi:hypothetical protein